jgi:hypothetical protein
MIMGTIGTLKPGDIFQIAIKDRHDKRAFQLLVEMIITDKANTVKMQFIKDGYVKQYGENRKIGDYVSFNDFTFGAGMEHCGYVISSPLGVSLVALPILDITSDFKEIRYLIWGDAVFTQITQIKLAEQTIKKEIYGN